MHTVLVWQTGWTSWRLGGFGMYAEPSYIEYRGAAVVVCKQTACLDVVSDVDFFAPLRHFEVPLLEPTPSGEARYRLISSKRARRELSFALATFRKMPTEWHAEGLVRERLAAACGPYLVVLYTQHVSMITRKATVESRPFVVDLEAIGCTDERRVLERRTG